VAAARGSHIIMLSDDDFLAPHFLNRCSSQVLETAQRYCRNFCWGASLLRCARSQSRRAYCERAEASPMTGRTQGTS
jgi:hypothetical protein